MPPRGLVAILAALSMLGALSIDAYLPALPAIATAFHTTLAAVQQTLTIYLFAFAFMTLFYGTLSDSFGRRSVILVSLVLYIASSLGASCADNLGSLMIFRLLQGLSAGAGSVIGRAIVSDLLKGAAAQKMMSYISVIFGLAPAIAPILGGWLQAAFGWRSIFLFIAFFGIVLLLVCLRWLPESLPKSERHPFHFKILVGHYWQVGCHGRFMLGALGSAFSFSGVMLYVASAPAFVIGLLHLTVKDFGYLFIPLIGGMTLGSTLAGKLSHRLRAATTIKSGFAIMAAAALANLAYTAIFAIKLPWVIMPLFVYGIGMAIAMPAMTVIMLEMFPKVRGLSASLQTFVFMLVFALGSGLVAPFLFDSAFKLAAGSVAGLAVSGLCWWLGSREVPELEGRVEIVTKAPLPEECRPI